MTRTIYVVFPQDINGKSFYSFHAKKYMFLCNYDCVTVGDLITDPRYTSSMMVVQITDKSDRVQEGITLKDIYITHIDGTPISQPVGLSNGSIIKEIRENNMEKRTIKVTLEQAIEWYNSGSEVLKKLALTVFTEEELTLNMNYIRNAVSADCVCINVPIGIGTKARAFADLLVIAKYFNKGWKKTPSNTGYFLGRSSLGFSNNPKAITINGLNHIGIVEHNTVMYPGIVYFKEKEDLIKAVKIMGDKIKDLF